MKRAPAVLLVASTLAMLSEQLHAQTGGFVAMLGADTVQVDRFVRQGTHVDGVVVTRSPVTRVMRYSLTLNSTGGLSRYEMATSRGDGTPIRASSMAGSLSFSGDTIVRETLKDTVTDVQHIAAPFGAVPSPTLPYLGVSYLMYEIAFAQARTRANAAGESAIYLLTMSPGQPTPQKTTVWLVGSDSAEANYFNVARSGYRFDAQGRLVRVDWTGTTYRYRVNRVADLDVETIAKGWAAADARGQSMGAMSPRDTARASVGDATTTIDYGRPSKRGRLVWGDVVPWGKVWRLGADMATHLTTSAGLKIGGVDVPAGMYSLWLLPTEHGESMLVVSRDAPVWGTNYNPAHDLARIPIRRVDGVPPVERLSIGIENGALWIRWDTTAWSIPVTRGGLAPHP